MVNLPIWQRIIIAIIVIAGLWFAFPNTQYQAVENANNAQARIDLGRAEAGDEQIAQSWPSYLPNDIVNLGLDLRGGVHLVVETQLNDVHLEQYESFWASAQARLREKPELGAVTPKISETGIQISPADPSMNQAILSELEGINSEFAGGIYDIEQDGNDIMVTLSGAGLAQLDELTMARTLEIIRRRIDGAGTMEPTIQRLQEDRVLIDVPGFGSVEEVLDIIGKTAKLSIQTVVGTTNDPNAIVDFDQEVLPNLEGGYYIVERKIDVSGDMIVDAFQGFHQTNNSPVVNFRLNTQGAQAFGEHTATNIGGQSAFVLDGEVISAPSINQIIPGGSAYIEGGFTVESATQLAVLLRAGALPASLKVLEQSVVGPDLGQDSINAGITASIIALVAIAAFLILTYRIYGIFANIALFVNIILIIAALSIIGSVLTLPGIAGIVLTIGMAVDANVLIFERIKEEYLKKPNLIRAIDQGYSQAFSSILDANVTTFIAAFVLYYFGAGPVRGFAITLMIGIITSVFTAIFVTRLLTVIYLERRKPKALKMSLRLNKIRNITFMKFARLTLLLSSAFVAISILATVFIGPNFGIDFLGGTQIRIQVEDDTNISDVRAVVNQTITGDVAVRTETGAESGRLGMLIDIASEGDEAAMSETEISDIRNAILSTFPDSEIRSVNSIGGAVSSELVNKGIMAVLITLVAIGIYIWLRFEAAFALGAILALGHDVALTLGLFVITGLTFDLSIVAALLAIIGYSLNDTVVVYDRIREKFAISKSEPIENVIDSALNETLSRTLMTSLTTLIAILALWIFGGEVLRGFSIAMMFGVIVGTYSSIFLASPILRFIGVDRSDKPKATTKFSDIDA